MLPTSYSRRQLAAIAIAACGIILCGLALVAPTNTFECATAGMLMLGMARLQTDAQCRATRALPAAPSTTVDGAAIDLGLSSRGDFLGGAELRISAPALNATILPDTRTMTYSVIHSDNANLSGASVLLSSVINQVGAAGAGADEATVDVALPIDVKRYVGLRITSGASTTDASTKTATAELVF